jgi:hypothetical protein
MKWNDPIKPDKNEVGERVCSNNGTEAARRA